MTSKDSEVSRLGRADALGLAFVRTTIILNSGAILAILTFAGNADASRMIWFEFESIKCAMWSFLVGIASILLALIISYSYMATAPQYCWHSFWDNWIIPFNVVLGILSVGAFLFGVGVLISGSVSTQ
ncbi:MAG: hypothetical protein H5U16_00350 [Roseovarius sp.]|nr:hypothetical protein [Roseovarius sp.]